MLAKSEPFLENIERSYSPQIMPCGERNVVLGGSRPSEHQFQRLETVGRSTIGLQTNWDCCPKPEGGACGNTQVVSGF